jgi:hypothetical protein
VLVSEANRKALPSVTEREPEKRHEKFSAHFLIVSGSSVVKGEYRGLAGLTTWTRAVSCGLCTYPRKSLVSFFAQRRNLIL